MRVTSQLLLASALLCAETFAVPTQVKRTPHEKRGAHQSPRWTKRDRLDARQVMPVRIGLAHSQTALEDGHNKLMDMAHPDSDNYGKWMTSEEVVDWFAPAQDAVDAVRTWLSEAGIAAERVSQSANKQWLQFDSPVGELEGLLDTQYHVFEHSSNGRMGVSCEEYHVPEHLQAHIDYITPGVKMLETKKPKPAVQKRGFRAGGSGNFSGPSIIGAIEKALFGNFTDNLLLSLCDTLVTPPCIRAAYNFTEGTTAATGNELGIFEFGDVYAVEDLVEFFTLFAPEIPITTQPNIDRIDGAVAPSVVDPGVEADLDFQLAYPIVYPQQTTLFQSDDIFYSNGINTNATGFFNSFLDAIDGSYCIGQHQDTTIDPYYPDPNLLGYQGNRQCGVFKPTHVVSVSYGEQEDDVPTAYQQRQCNEFMKLAMQGTTIVIASGDSGVAARAADDNNADGCLGKGEVFNPDFPASCPYAVAVGATLLTGAATSDVETAVTRFPSGGGFSNVYAQPSWQKNAVNNYLTAHKPSYKPYYLTTSTNNPTEAQTNGGIYNAAGRGYPDVSAIGDNVVVINDGIPTLVGGTSASAPIVASLFTRINEERLAAGKSPIGFVQPTLYANPGAFHDITVGNNSGCGTPGFYAATGWDPVTGLGTPNYPALLKAFMANP